MLNNAKNIEVTLKNIKKVLKKDGKVIIVEAIGESVQMLISQAFMMQEPDDARAEKNETFLKLYQWHEHGPPHIASHVHFSPLPYTGNSLPWRMLLMNRGD